MNGIGGKDCSAHGVITAYRGAVVNTFDWRSILDASGNLKYVTPIKDQGGVRNNCEKSKFSPKILKLYFQIFSDVG